MSHEIDKDSERKIIAAFRIQQEARAMYSQGYTEGIVCLRIIGERKLAEAKRLFNEADRQIHEEDSLKLWDINP